MIPAPMGVEAKSRDRSGIPAEVAATLDHCERVSSKARNNLWSVAQAFDDAKYFLFIATYATMRVIDDAVDEDFLEQPADEREESRAETHRCIDRWLAQVEAAAAGDEPRGPDVLEPEVFRALAFFLPRSDLDTRPWARLAASLHRDVDERELASWDDFLDYCEGACVAPAAIFIYILACGVGQGSGTSLDLPRRLDDYARDMAVFCYLTHILRDLQEDAHRHPQLLTIPRSFLLDAGITVEAMREKLACSDLEPLQPVLARLVEAAAEYERRTRRRLEELLPRLAPVERVILDQLIGRYVSTFAAVRASAVGRAAGSLPVAEAGHEID